MLPLESKGTPIKRQSGNKRGRWVPVIISKTEREAIHTRALLSIHYLRTVKKIIINFWWFSDKRNVLSVGNDIKKRRVKEGLNKQTKETVDEINYKVRIQILLKKFSRKKKKSFTIVTDWFLISIKVHSHSFPTGQLKKAQRLVFKRKCKHKA